VEATPAMIPSITVIARNIFTLRLIVLSYEKKSLKKVFQRFVANANLFGHLFSASVCDERRK
jgi:hypothetical protein